MTIDPVATTTAILTGKVWRQSRYSDRVRLKSGEYRNGALYRWRYATIEEILTLQPGDRFEGLSDRGVIISLRVNGQIKRWKREPQRFEIPVKYGLRDCARWNQHDRHRFVVCLGLSE